jgi:hypothetical protein
MAISLIKRFITRETRLNSHQKAMQRSFVTFS